MTLLLLYSKLSHILHSVLSTSIFPHTFPSCTSSFSTSVLLFSLALSRPALLPFPLPSFNFPSHFPVLHLPFFHFCPFIFPRTFPSLTFSFPTSVLLSTLHFPVQHSFFSTFVLLSSLSLSLPFLLSFQLTALLHSPHFNTFPCFTSLFISFPFCLSFYHLPILNSFTLPFFYPSCYQFPTLLPSHLLSGLFPHLHSPFKQSLSLLRPLKNPAPLP